MLLKCYVDTFKVNVSRECVSECFSRATTNSLANDEINSELRSANKSAKRRYQKFKFALKQQAFQHPLQKEHLSIQLLEIIQIILFMMV